MGVGQYDLPVSKLLISRVVSKSDSDLTPEGTICRSNLSIGHYPIRNRRSKIFRPLPPPPPSKGWKPFAPPPSPVSMVSIHAGSLVKTTPKIILPPPPSPSAWIQLFPSPLFVGVKLDFPTPQILLPPPPPPHTHTLLMTGPLLTADCPPPPNYSLVLPPTDNTPPDHRPAIYQSVRRNHFNSF